MVITGLSGGKTSAYIAANYPSDVLLFSLVCADDPRCGYPDKKVMQYANDKIAKHCSAWGEVLGTAEDPIIFKTMIELEQFLGKEITWVRGLSFDQLIKKKNSMPIKQARWCTTFLKIEPAFFYWFNNFAPDIVGFNVGYRYDEKERQDNFSTTFSYADYSNNYGDKRKHWVHDVVWRYGQFPLIENKVVRPTVNKFWSGKEIPFASDSNCQHCMFKPIQQVKRNFINNPSQILWARKIEETMKYNWHHDFSIRQAMNIGVDLEFAFGDSDAGCSAGECTA